MAKFDLAIPLILLHEGEEYTNDPDDAGGPTKWGVTIPDIPGATAVTIMNLTREQACEIYRRKYWAPMRGDEIVAQPVADIFLDLGVARGIHGAVDMARQALSLPPQKRADWGRLDDETLNAMNAACAKNHLQFAFDFLNVCDAARIARVRADATQAKFLPGWLRRNKHDLAHVFCLDMPW